jgi:hypothetical protein
MIYLKEPNTSRIVQCKSEASIGAGFANWIVATESEIEVYKLQEAKALKIAQCKAYLASTDWQVTRLCDPTSGEPLKEGVAEKRSLVRSLQVDIEACETLEELENININFS